MSDPIPVRLPKEVVAYLQQRSNESMVPFGALVRSFVIEKVKQICPDLVITI